MVTRIYKTLVKVFFIFSFLYSEDTNWEGSRLLPVELSVYEGHRSLLLNWSVNDSIVTKKATIYSRKSSDQDYLFLEEIEPQKNKFLDLNCEIGERYFYFIEVEDFFGNLYSSDKEYPVFGTCLESVDTLAYDPMTKDMKTLILNEIISIGSTISPDLNIENILYLFNSEVINEGLWIEKYPMNQLTEIYDHLYLIDQIIYDSQFFDKILDKEDVYRNYFYILPGNWIKEVEDEFENIKSDWNKFFKAYEKSVALISEVPSLFVLGIFPDSNDKKRARILVNEKQQHFDIDRGSYLLFKDEFLDISGLEKDSLNTIFVDIPKNWEYLDLISGESFLQRVPLWIPGPIINTIDGELIPGDSTFFIKYKADSLSAWFNEVVWSPSTLKLDLEAAGSPEFDDYYAFSLNDIFIWEPEWELTYETQFIDSSFTLDQDFNFPILLSWNKWIEDGWSPVEFMILDSLPLAINRFPDGGKWSNLTSTSLGMSNNPLTKDIDQQLIPEFFVLYQNYPNPFNGVTRLTFDLLEDSMVSFYVTDATGRVQDMFLNNEFINSGTYNFDWNGENYSTGIYFFTIQVQSGNYSPMIMSRKMIYLK